MDCTNLRKRRQGREVIFLCANTTWYLYNFRKTTIQHLLSRDYIVGIMAPIDEYSSLLEDLGCSLFSVRIDAGGTNPLRDLKYILDVGITLLRQRPNLVLNFTAKPNIYVSLAASALGIPFINNISGVGSQLVGRSTVSIVLDILYKISQKGASHTFFQNTEDLELFLDRKYVARGKNTRLMGSGVDLSRFNLRPFVWGGPFIFLFIGRLLKEKGVEDFVKAASILKRRHSRSIQFQIVGFVGIDNPSAIKEEQLKLWIDKGYVDFLGASDCVEDVIANAHAVVLPSYYGEGVPKSLIEAAAIGRPIVTTNSIGCRDVVVQGVTGFLHEPRSLEGLVKACDSILCMSNEELEEMGRQGNIKARSQFSDEVNISAYAQQIEAALSEVR